MAKSTRGVKVCITKGGSTPTDLSPTAITKAKPAVVTCTGTGVVDGDLVYVTGTGLASIDGKVWVAASATATDIELLGSDTTNDTGTFTGGTAKADHYASGDMECLCLSSLSFNADTPSAISTATYCDPTGSIPSAVVSAGTLDFGGYVDITDADYQELLLAEEDGKERLVRITLPDNGYLVSKLTFSTIAWDLPIDGAVAYSGSAVLGSKFRHLFA